MLFCFVKWVKMILRLVLFYKSVNGIEFFIEFWVLRYSFRSSILKIWIPVFVFSSKFGKVLRQILHLQITCQNNIVLLILKISCPSKHAISSSIGFALLWCLDSFFFFFFFIPLDSSYQCPTILMLQKHLPFSPNLLVHSVTIDPHKC